MTRTHSACLMTALLVSTVLLQVAAMAGPLTPPVGPVTATPGIEPRIPITTTSTPGDAASVCKITQSGSYYLTGNITGQANKSAILIAASNVTIDLNGFVLTGVNGSTAGIEAGGRTNITVRNGSITGFGSYAINTTGGSGSIISGVLAEACAQGVYAGTNAVIERTTVRAITNGTGIFIEGGSRVSDCAVESCSIGYSIGAGSSVSRSIASKCSLNGFSGANNAVYQECTATANPGVGFKVSSGVTLDRCVANNNGQHGFQFSFQCMVTNCTARGNGTAGNFGGFYADGTSTNNLIQSNCAVGNSAFGFKVDAGNNLILGNRSGVNNSGASNYVIVAGNRVGNIVPLAQTVSLINGNSGGSGTTDPWTNFAY